MAAGTRPRLLEQSNDCEPRSDKLTVTVIRIMDQINADADEQEGQPAGKKTLTSGNV